MDRPTVIITRTQPHADGFARAVSDLGFHPVVVPLLQAEATNTDPPCPYTDIDAVVFTSAQALRFIPADLPRDCPVYAVGATTAQSAKNAGFDKVHIAGGDVVALGDAVRVSKITGTWVHIGPEERAEGTDKALTGCLHWPVYRTVSCAIDFDAVAPYIQGTKPCFMVFHSAKAARSFKEVIRVYGLPAKMTHIKVLCLSTGVLECLSSIQFGQTYVANTPDEDALLTLLQESA